MLDLQIIDYYLEESVNFISLTGDVIRRNTVRLFFWVLSGTLDSFGSAGAGKDQKVSSTDDISPLNEKQSVENQVIGFIDPDSA
ncbi:hypothetical protein [Pedobacter metabolipauper]|uniref:Uncharacterized protein n=1 Tax=Pedobacter metabolipauper TaxID=425513 RepID=A0A4R6T3K8_9SPHI|nr:hypothetical protein [Pedobacter metabolipauper]TDQ12120.1 hypothetical protein ATK78_1251 [Pedobacter metabolipauper]